MGCFHPIQAWRTTTGEIILAKEQEEGIQLRLPCGGCLGCRMATAQAWTLRCQLELQAHKSAVFTTLTYNDENLPLTLQKEHVSLWLRRLRKTTDKIQRGRPKKDRIKLRFFAAGEYGETRKRPHYHAILYGLGMADEHIIQNEWNDGTGTRYRDPKTLGYTYTEPITPARIAYTAGYCQKKIGYKRYPHERVDPLTGELYEWEPPFRLMSRQPGIGGEARQWAQSWRLYAVKDGHKMAVPRFLHEAWKQQATIIEQEELAYEKYKLSLNRDNSRERLEAEEKIAEAKQRETARKRNY